MKPVKIGVLGVSNHYERRLLTPLSHLKSIELTAIGSRDATRAERAAREWGFKRSYGSYQQVVDDTDVEMIYNVLPNNMHAPWIIKCADAGKPILCEKPVALNAKDAAKAFDYAAQKGVLAMEAFMYRYHPQWIKAKELVDSGAIGDILSIHTAFSFYNEDKTDIRNQKNLGGGALYDIGCYAISSARFLIGHEPVRVNAQIQMDDACDVDVLTSAIVDFGGPRLLFTVSTRMSPYQQVTVYGSKGSLTVKRPFNAYADAPMQVLVENNAEQQEFFCGPEDQYALLFDAFAHALRNEATNLIPASDAVANMQVIDAVFQSAKSQNWEAVLRNP